MRAFITLCVLLLSTATSHADDHEKKYWVVGSFKQLGSAISESRRIEGESGEIARVARFEMPGGALYRIVVPEGGNAERQKRVLGNAGVEPWIVPIAGDDLNFVEMDTDGMDIEFRLIVGAFSKADRARAFASDVSSRGPEPASVIESDGAGVYRVALGPYRYRKAAAEANARDLGIDGAWWVAEQVERIAIKPDPEPGPEPESVAIARLAPSSPEPRPLRPPGANESYIDYCVKKASPREREIYCQDDRFSAVALSEQKVREGAGGQTYADFCAMTATPALRKKYCTDTTFSERVTP
ncbi:MAG: SPOR domain-containing protein [Pseudomonadales bacterium]